MEQAAQCLPIHGRSRVDHEPNNPMRAVIHQDEALMGCESEGLTPKEIHTPQVILCVAKESQPRGAIRSLQLIVGSEDSSHDIFIDTKGKYLGNLVRNFGAPKVWITAFHFQDEINQLPRGPLRPRLPSFLGRVQQVVFPFDQGVMILQEGRGFDNQGRPLEAAKIR